MVDLTQSPYFSYGPVIDALMIPIKSQVDINLINFVRNYHTRERFLIGSSTEWIFDYYCSAKKLYRYGLFERDPKGYDSSYHMWDHLPCDPHQIYQYRRQKHNQAHGLTIVQQYDRHCDFFFFTSHPNNHQINNFYLNKKELFSEFIHNFYVKLAANIQTLEKHTFFLEGNTGEHISSISLLSPRQQDCVLLMADGLTNKEIAKSLGLSPRTIEDYINILKIKFEAKNRSHLLGQIHKHLASPIVTV